MIFAEWQEEENLDQSQVREAGTVLERCNIKKKKKCKPREPVGRCILLRKLRQGQAASLKVAFPGNHDR